MDNKTQLTAAFGTFVLALIILGAIISLQGLVFSYLWLWFLVPLGLPAIGLVHALMLVLMARLAVMRIDFDKKTDKSLVWIRSGQMIGLWLFAWGLGYLLSHAV